MIRSVRRRDLLRLGAAVGLTAVAAPAFAQSSSGLATIDMILEGQAPGRADARALDAAAPRRAALHNLHTGDAFDEVYFADGRYIPDALAEATRVMRDWRNGEEHFIDPALFDALHAVRGKLETPAPFQIISGYRSPATNRLLHARSSQVAEHSQHVLGKAIDVRLEGVDLRNLREAALSVGAGGVGFYPVSNFVHIDTGRVRQWSGA